MPILREGPETAVITVAPSAALELMWVMHNCGADHVLTGSLASLEHIREELRPQLDAFWDDGIRGFEEIVILAHRAGALQSLDLDDFLAGLDRTASMPAPMVSLLCESPRERAAFAARLERLTTDAGLRARYVSLMNDVWAEVRSEWESTGRPAALAAAAEWVKRLADGISFRDLLQRQRLWWRRPDLDEMADTAAAEGRLVLSPGWFFGEIHVIELDGAMYLGRGIRPRDDESKRREVAHTVSTSLKVLADPTRLAILLWLAREPASVTEIAKHFKLSQPTISAHVQLLRDAGVLDEKSVGRSAKLAASEEGLKHLFTSAQETLLKQFRK